MLSALIFDAHDAAALGRSLSTLVAGVVDGVLRDVVIVDPNGNDVLRIADHAGCQVRAFDNLKVDVETLKGEWVLVLRSGGRLPQGWPERVLAFLDDGLRGNRSQGARLPLAGDTRRSVWHRWFGRMDGALIVPKAHLARHLHRGGGLDDVGRRLSLRRLMAQAD